MRLSSALACLVVLVGCQAMIGDPTGGADESRVDGAAPDDRGTDAAVVPPAPVDAGLPDASTEARCVTGYGAAEEFQLCSFTDDTCTFVAANGDVTCAQHCALGGGECLGAEDNRVGKCDELENDPTADCSTTGKIDLRCTCTLPPGS